MTQNDLDYPNSLYLVKVLYTRNPELKSITLLDDIFQHWWENNTGVDSCTISRKSIILRHIIKGIKCLLALYIGYGLKKFCVAGGLVI